ncbi:MAG: ATP-binding protein, partial [Gemmatimonadaceae bacterium]
TVTVSARAAQSGSGHTVVQLTIEDTGRGMTEEELARAFDDFYTTKQGGTGLGLSVVRRLVLDLDGALRVSTKPGEGTRFEIDVPATDEARSSPAFRVPHSSSRIPHSPA